MLDKCRYKMAIQVDRDKAEDQCSLTSQLPYQVFSFKSSEFSSLPHQSPSRYSDRTNVKDLLII